MSIEFLTKVNEDGTIFLPEEYRHLQSHIVKVQLDLQEEDIHISLLELAQHEPIIEGDVYLIKYERLSWDDDDRSQFVIKKVQRITEQARREIIDLHKRIFGIKGA